MFGSANGFQTNVWGPYAWFFLHTVTLNFVPERRLGYVQFFMSLADVLPCGACRDNYTRIITGDDPRLRLAPELFTTRTSVARWLFRVHVKVQSDIYEKTGKKRDIPRFEDTKKDFIRAMRQYEQYRASCHKNAYGCVLPKKGYTKSKAIIQIRSCTR